MTVGYGYGAHAFGTIPYFGGIPATITPDDLQLGIPFMVGNDRYQVVVCADKGTASSSPQFRYWFASGQQWGHELAGDTRIPRYYATDENGDAVVGELQLAPRDFEYIRTSGNRRYVSDVLVDKIVVDFVPRPTALTSETVVSSEPLGFTGHVEGYGVTEYLREDGTSMTFSGTAVSDSFTFQSSCGEQASDVWPAVRSVALPVRFNQRCRNVRVVLTEIRHVEILRVALFGDLGPIRET